MKKIDNYVNLNIKQILSWREICVKHWDFTGSSSRWPSKEISDGSSRRPSSSSPVSPTSRVSPLSEISSLEWFSLFSGRMFSRYSIERETGRYEISEWYSSEDYHWRLSTFSSGGMLSAGWCFRMLLRAYESSDFSRDSLHSSPFGLGICRTRKSFCGSMTSSSSKTRGGLRVALFCSFRE